MMLEKNNCFSLVQVFEINLYHQIKENGLN